MNQIVKFGQSLLSKLEEKTDELPVYKDKDGKVLTLLEPPYDQVILDERKDAKKKILEKVMSAQTNVKEVVGNAKAAPSLSNFDDFKCKVCEKLVYEPIQCIDCQKVLICKRCLQVTPIIACMEC